MTRICRVILVGLALLLAACQQSATGPSTTAATNAARTASAAQTPVVTAEEGTATKAQPKLPTMKLFVGPEVVETELALTRAQVMTGMMFRKEMGENEGMLFVFAAPHRPAFYMKNTLVPLTAAYIDSEGTILELHDLQPLNETPVEAGTNTVQFVLEMKQGWFKRHNVAPGSVITCDKGRLLDVFRPNSR